MSKTKIFTTFEKISSVFLLLSFCLNLYLGIKSNKLNNEINENSKEFQQFQMEIDNSKLTLENRNRRLEELEFELNLLSEKPKLSYSRFIFPGETLKRFLDYDYSKAIIEEIPHPEFVVTNKSRKLFRIIEETSGKRKLNTIEAEFLVIKNSGNTEAIDLVLKSSNQDKGMNVGKITPKSSKLILLSFRRTQPWVEEKDNYYFSFAEFHYHLLGEKQREEFRIDKKSELSWIPTLNSFYGVGKALFSDEHSHLHNLQNRE